jgi:hypothetical protein
MTNDTDPGSDPGTVEAAIEQPNGGVTTTDEAPQFGEPDQFEAASIEADAPVTDSMANDPAMIELGAHADAARFRVAIVWGQLPPDRTVTAVTDWSGSISLSRGGLLVRHRIAFEDATDRILPRTELASVSFDSKTRPAADGLVLELVDPTPSAGPLTLTYTPASGAPIVYQMSDLLAGPVAVDVGADGNRMIAIAMRDGACDHGVLRGRWHAFRDGLGGFLGVVADADGNPIGHVRGIYGTRKNGEQVFFGKYIANDGKFVGILAGHWDDGHFVGRWLDRSGEHGRVQGLYREKVGGVDAGHFIGRWAESSCAAEMP